MHQFAFNSETSYWFLAPIFVSYIILIYFLNIGLIVAPSW